jgi:hypothetical protein
MVFLCSACAGLLMLTSCEKEGEGENETVISYNRNTESHNEGQNCMSCHRQGGEGEGWFNVAGTIYTEAGNTTNPNGLVELYTGPGGTGTLAYRIEVDARGNFYTTEDIQFGSGLYPVAVGSGAKKYMSDPVTSGQCSSCHGDSTDKIRTN